MAIRIPKAEVPAALREAMIKQIELPRDGALPHHQYRQHRGQPWPDSR